MAPLRFLPRRLALLVVGALALGLLTPLANSVPSPVPAPAAQAADLSQFRAGNIIDDTMFYNGQAMTAAEIQAFLNDKIGGCRNGQCLNVLTAGISSRPAYVSSRTGNLVCSAIQGGVFSIAEIIYRAQVACGISAKVILVTLQKEQGLTTSRGPSSWNLNAAMGAYCPDTAPCDPAYAGVGAQIIAGTVQLKTYRAAQFNRQPGPNWIGFNPNSGCGGSVVNIENYATAALYNYTPYQPNASALAAGYGIGDGCGAYGNRNFFQYFSDWFGSPRGIEVGSYFRSYYDANKSWLGSAILPMVCGGPDGGCSQRFEGGSIFSSGHSYAAGVPLAYLSAWGNYGREYGILGYPVSEKRCDDMGAGLCRQEFQGGWVVASPSGYRIVQSAYRSVWSNWGREFGALGVPTSDLACAGGMCQQSFQNGVLVKGDTSSVRVLMTAVDTLWSAWGRQGGILGLAVADPSVAGGASYTQPFQGGTVTVTNGVARVSAATDPWFNVVLSNPWLGQATSARSCTLAAGGCFQKFQNGWVMRSEAGSFAMPNVVVDTWWAWGREYGVLGFPSGGQTADPLGNNYSQSFQGGVVTVTAGVARVSSSTDPWFNAVLTSPWLGSPTGVRSCTLAAGGCFQPFQNGWVMRSAAGSFAVPTAVVDTWWAWGREYGVLGFPAAAPSADPATGTYTQAFEGGTVTVTAGAARVSSSTDPWFNAVLTSPWLGSASGERSCTLGAGGCFQRFQNGWVMRSAAGSFAVPTAVLDTWWAWGREYGVLGFPSGAPSADPASGNYTQAFQGGVVTVTAGAARVTGATDPWFNAVLTSPWLGSSSGVRSCTLGAGGCFQSFQNGWVVRSAAGAYAVPAAAVQMWGWWGREYGALGYPVGTVSGDPASGTYTQAFQGGTIVVTAGVAAVQR